MSTHSNQMVINHLRQIHRLSTYRKFRFFLLTCHEYVGIRWRRSRNLHLASIQACVDLPLQYSCENTTELTNSCCNVVKGGLVLQTQFRDTYTGLERIGQLLPQGSWGIHGLWPDNCDG